MLPHRYVLKTRLTRRQRSIFLLLKLYSFMSLEISYKIMKAIKRDKKLSNDNKAKTFFSVAMALHIGESLILKTIIRN